MDRIAEDSFVFVPLETATVPPGGLIEHLKDRWWMVHPEKGVAFFVTRGFHAAQCNRNEAITRRLAENYPWAEVRFIPSVFRKIKPQDYI